MTTEEKVLKIAETSECALIKAKELFPEFFIKHNEYSIYAFKSGISVYKLHRIANSTYAWICINDSLCYADGTHNLAEKALKSYAGKYVEFSNLKSFASWLNNQI